jgi:CheY-like chemotaxis protein
MGEGIQLVTDLSASEDMVEGESSQLRQVLVNLCLNARDAMQGRGTLTIRTQLREVMPEECRLQQDWTPGLFVEISVHDTGCGLQPKVKDRVFEPFFTTKGVRGGTGLGLSVVRGIVRTHHGHVAVESEGAGKGSTFRVRLPPLSQAKMQSDLPASNTAREQDDTGGKMILVIDDERAVLTFAQKVLERAGYRVRLAIHATVAYEQLESFREELSLIILDLTMPGISGKEVLSEIRKTDPEIPVMVSSGFAEGGLDDDLVQQVQGFLKKPYRPADLIEQVREVLNEPKPAE